MVTLEIQGHTAPHLKAHRYGIYETRSLSCGSTSNIYQSIMKSGNLLHKWAFVKIQMLCTAACTNIRTLQKTFINKYQSLKMFQEKLERGNKVKVSAETTDHNKISYDPFT